MSEVTYLSHKRWSHTMYTKAVISNPRTASPNIPFYQHVGYAADHIFYSYVNMN